MNGVAGIIFSNLHDRSIPELTAVRTMGAIPIGGGYRMIDFPLSAMVNSGIKNISVIAHHNYESLLEHIGNGAEWGVPIDRGGVKILSPFMTAYAKRNGEEYATRLDSLKSISDNLERVREKYIVMSDCDCVFNLDIGEMLAFHSERNADLTVCSNVAVSALDDGRIIELDLSPSAAFDLNVCLWVFNRDFLVGMIKNAISRGYSSFTRDLLGGCLHNYRVYQYKFTSEILRIKSITEYYRLNIRLLKDEGLRKELFKGIRSKNVEAIPSRIGCEAVVRGSAIGHGCVIDGIFENSIAFGNVKVEKGAVVKNSILFPNVKISSGAKLDFVIADKNTAVREGSILAGCKMLPYFIGIGKTV